jgi:hypothetical protein
MFPGQNLTEDEQVAIANRFGDIELLAPDPEQKAVAISNQVPDGSVMGTEETRRVADCEDARRAGSRSEPRSASGGPRCASSSSVEERGRVRHDPPSKSGEEGPHYVFSRRATSGPVSCSSKARTSAQ